MTGIYNKSKLTFSLLWIGIYVVSASIADSMSQTIGVNKIITVPLLIALSIVLYVWISKNNLKKEYGLTKVNQSSMLYFLPLALLITANLWNGVTLNMPIIDTCFYIVSMLLVGFLEELIFRGFLFKTLNEMGIKKAFIISSVTFGFGHIVNLLNGAQLLPTVLQIISAIAIGFLFTLIFYKTKSLLPCIITHGTFNSLSAFAVEPNNAMRIVTCFVICLIAVSYSFYIIKRSN